MERLAAIRAATRRENPFAPPARGGGWGRGRDQSGGMIPAQATPVEAKEPVAIPADAIAAYEDHIDVDRSEFVQIAPQVDPNTTSPGSVLTFGIDRDSAAWIDLAGSYVISTCNIKAAGGGDYTLSEPVTTAEDFAAAMWSQMTLRLNGAVVSNDVASSMNVQADFVEKALVRPFTWGAASYPLVTAFYDATPGGLANDRSHNMVGAGMGSVEHCCFTAGDENPNVWVAGLTAGTGGFNTSSGKKNGAARFRNWLVATDAGAPSFQVIYRPEGFFRQHALLPPYSGLQLDLTRANHNACILSTFDNAGVAAKYAPTLSITQSILFLRKVWPTSMAAEKLEATLQTAGEFRMPFRYCRATKFAIANGSTVLNQLGALSGTRPDVVVVAFIKTAALTSDYRRSPLNFHQNSGNDQCLVERIAVSVSGVRYPRDGDYTGYRYRPPAGGDNVENLYMRAYAEYARMAREGHDGGDGPLVSFAQWSRAYQLWTFCTRPDGKPVMAGGVATDDRAVAQIDVHVAFNGGNLGANYPIDMSCLVFAFTTAEVVYGADRTVQLSQRRV